MKTDSHANKVFIEIRRKILSSQLPSNTRLKEDEWAKKIGVSRITIREALTRLLGEGLLTKGEKGGFYVRGLAESDVHNIRQIREVLEMGAIRLAIHQITPEGFKELDKICDDFTSMVKNKYYGGALEADMRFHEKLVELSGNTLLMQVYRSSHIPLFHQKLGEAKGQVDDYELTDVEHRLIVKSLKEKKLKTAEAALVKHFARGEAVVLDLD